MCFVGGWGLNVDYLMNIVVYLGILGIDDFDIVELVCCVVVIWGV